MQLLRLQVAVEDLTVEYHFGPATGLSALRVVDRSGSEGGSHLLA